MGGTSKHGRRPAGRQRPCPAAAPARSTGFTVMVLALVVAIGVWSAPGLPLAGAIFALALATGALVLWHAGGPAPDRAGLDREVRRHSSEREWRGLLEVEEATSAGERRLLLAREFRRLAEEMLAIDPANLRAWPPAGRLSAVRRQANLLAGSAADQHVGYLPESRPDDPLTAERLTAAARTLAAYASLLQTVQPLDRWDLELLRVLTRERTRLQVAYDDVAETLAHG